MQRCMKGSCWSCSSYPGFKVTSQTQKNGRTQVAGISYKNCELILFEPNLGELEEKCLLAPEILTSITTINNMVLVLESHECEPINLEVG